MSLKVFNVLMNKKGQPSFFNTVKKNKLPYNKRRTS
jgi:hypothetical protein